MDGVIDGFGKNEPIFLRGSRATASSRSRHAADAGAVDRPERVGVPRRRRDRPEPWQAHADRSSRYHPTGTKTIADFYLVARPYPGFPLDDGETYALVLTRRIGDAYGGKVEARGRAGRRSLVEGQRRRCGPCRRAHRVQAAARLARRERQRRRTTARADVASAAVFTTQHTQFVVPGLKQAIDAAATRRSRPASRRRCPTRTRATRSTRACTWRRTSRPAPCRTRGRTAAARSRSAATARRSSSAPRTCGSRSPCRRARRCRRRAGRSSSTRTARAATTSRSSTMAPVPRSPRRGSRRSRWTRCCTGRATRAATRTSTSSTSRTRSRRETTCSRARRTRSRSAG